MIYKTNSESETMTLGIRFSKKLHPGTTYCLNGELGCGKTVFVRGVLYGLGYNDVVNSPTFSLCNVYRTTPKIYHYDLYRIHGFDELFTIGYYDQEEDAIAFIEWADNCRDCFDKQVVNINFYYGFDKNQRIIDTEVSF